MHKAAAERKAQATAFVATDTAGQVEADVVEGKKLVTPATVDTKPSIANAAKELVSAMGSADERRARLIRAQEAVDLAVEGFQHAPTFQTGAAAGCATTGTAMLTLSLC